MSQKRKRTRQRYLLLPPTDASAEGAEAFLRDQGITKIEHMKVDDKEVLVVFDDELNGDLRSKLHNKLHWGVYLDKKDRAKPPWYRPAQA